MEKINLWAIMCCRNEADIITYTLRHLFSQGVTGIVVADHCSTDETPDIVYRTRHVNPPVIVVRESNPVFRQSEIMTSLALIAAGEGADWILPCDSDELYFCPDGRTLAEAVGALPEHVRSISIGFHEYCVTGLDNPDELNPFKRMTWRRAEPGKLTKIAFRYKPGVVISEGNHDVVWKNGPKPEGASVQAGIHMAHFPYRGPEQFISKVVNSGRALDDLSSKTSSHIREFKRILQEDGEPALKDYFAANFYHGDPEIDELVRDPAPYMGER